MALAGTITHVEKNQNSLRVHFTLTFSGSYPGTPGETMNFSTFTQSPGSQAIISSSLPTDIQIYSLASSGYTYSYIPGSTNQNGTVTVLQGGAAVSEPQAQIATTTYPTGVSGDKVAGVVEFPYGI